MATLTHRLVLNEWIFSKLGYQSAKEGMNDLSSRLERAGTGWNEQNVFYFSEALKLNLLDNSSIKKDNIDVYESNIYQHWNNITKKRVIAEHRDIFPLYFQYLSLLFTEYYLDRFFQDLQAKTTKLVDEINNFRKTFNKRFKQKNDKIPEFTSNDLRKLAFWMATGSGKTLLMHCNILQINYYLDKYNLSNRFNKLILITPNEGLSKQHLDEFELSDISAKIYTKGSNMGRAYVDIIEITKLKETSGVTTVAVSEFGKNNLVFVDEGHRGSGGDEWFSKRQELCQDGFSCEYSATFGQSVNSLAKTKQTEMSNLYAKSILVDYSYRYFYADGFGKDFYITVLEKLKTQYQESVSQQLYLTNNLLKFYQQCKLYKEKKHSFTDYLIENPLMIMVGGTVTGKRETLRDTDVVTALKFLATFIKEKEASCVNIKLLIEGRAEILDNDRHSYDFFDYLDSLYPMTNSDSPKKIYDDILDLVFNSPGGGLLHAVYMKGSGSEVGLKIGDSNDYFGVINIGEPRKLWKMLEDDTDIITTEQSVSYSLFDTINSDHSNIRLLIGAKKFSEGWNSWRVSSMGLINVGQNEGSQIIQLFGRGVRLKGLDFSLKRSVAKDNPPKYLDLLETLNVFGINADYMAEFQEYINEEGVVKTDEVEPITLPLIQNIANKDLKVILPKNDMPDFKKEKLLDFKVEPNIRTMIQSDWYSRIRSISNKFNLNYTDGNLLHKDWLKEEHLKYIDIDKLYLELLKHKKSQAYYNIEIKKDNLEAMLRDSSWYVLYIPQHLLVFDSFKKIELWNEIALSISKAYLDKFNKYHKNLFQAPYREYRTLKEVLESDDNACLAFKKNLEFEYKLEINKSKEMLIRNIKTIKESLDKGELGDLSFDGLDIFNITKHLYNPLIYVINGTTEIKVTPTRINLHEKKFVNDLENWCKVKGKEYLAKRELYVLRNQERGKGVSFFDESNFYPDFIIWLVEEGKQKIIFADPHGLRHARGFDDAKILLAKNIKDIEKQLNDSSVSLHSSIISPTKYNEVNHWHSGLPSSEAFVEHNVFFMYDDEDYIDKMIKI